VTAGASFASVTWNESTPSIAALPPGFESWTLNVSSASLTLSAFTATLNDRSVVSPAGQLSVPLLAT